MERHSPEQNDAGKKADQSAEGLITHLASGGSLSPEIRQRLIEALKSTPAKSSEALDRLGKFEWCRQAHNPYLRKQIETLTDEQLDIVERLGDVLANNIQAFHVLGTKPLGAKIREWAEDYRGFELKPGQDWAKVAQWYKATSQGNLDKVVVQRSGSTVYILPTSNPQTSVWYADLRTPPYTTDIDSRPITSTYSFLLQDDDGKIAGLCMRFPNLIDHLIRRAAIKTNPDKAVFFDAPLGGIGNMIVRVEDLVSGQSKISSAVNARETSLNQPQHDWSSLSSSMNSISRAEKVSILNSRIEKNNPKTNGDYGYPDRHSTGMQR